MFNLVTSLGRDISGKKSRKQQAGKTNPKIFRRCSWSEVTTSLLLKIVHASNAFLDVYCGRPPLLSSPT